MRVVARVVLGIVAIACGATTSAAQEWVVADPVDSHRGFFSDNASALDLASAFRLTGARPATHFRASFVARSTRELDTAARLRFETRLGAEFGADSWGLFADTEWRVRDDLAGRESAALAGARFGGKLVIARAPRDGLALSAVLSGVLPIDAEFSSALATALIEPSLAFHFGVPRYFGINAELGAPISVESPRHAGARGLFELYAHSSDSVVAHLALRMEFAAGISGDPGHQRHAVLVGIRTTAGIFFRAAHHFGPDAPFAFGATIGWAFFG